MSNAAICPFCRTTADGEVVTCPQCGLDYHDDCWLENEGCAVPGCTGRAAAAATTESPPAAEALPAPSSVAVSSRWAPDPTGSHEYRWWDGRTWTDYVADAGETSVDRFPVARPGPPAAPTASPATAAAAPRVSQQFFVAGRPSRSFGLNSASIDPNSAAPTFGEAIGICFKKYVDFSGRASRPEFWWFFLFSLLVVLVASVIDEVLFGLALLGLLLPYLAVGARRLHDTGKAAPLLLIGLIPYLGGIALLIFFAADPDRGPNRFGPPPR